MKQQISTSMAAGIVVVVVLIAGFFLWRHYTAEPTLPPGMANKSASDYHTGNAQQKIERMKRTREEEARNR